MATFYENQQEARRKTGLLAFYFALAVTLIILAVDVVLFAADRYLFVSSSVIGPSHQFNWSMFSGFLQWLVSPRGLGASAITALILLAGSVFKTLALGKGGDRVAIMAGGTWVDLNTSDFKERQLLNVVEEMAIASGIKPPRVYLLREESGINAFVAGLTPNDTALAVTQGALEQLTRDELQGVIGHEFSHILNSDMRINVRMIGVLAGILMIGQIGRLLMDTRSRRISTRSNKKGGNPLPFIGLALWFIGSIGLFFGQLIQAALSRQREFLADASSVQFTRNPLGIGGALIKIRDASQQSFLVSRHASDISHMCFGEVMRHRFTSLFATHPPLDERIQAIDPRLEKRLAAERLTASASDASQVKADAPIEITPGAADNGIPYDGATGFATPSDSVSHISNASHISAASPISAADLKASVGQLTTQGIDIGQRLHRQMPASLLAAAHHPDQAELLLYALVLAAPQQDAAVRQELKALFGEERLGLLVRFRSEVMAMPLVLRLPLFDLTMPTLQHLPTTQKTEIQDTLLRIIRADKRFTLSECAYFLLATKYLNPPAKTGHSINSIHKVESQVIHLFVALAHASRKQGDDLREHFCHAMRCLGIQTDLSVVDQAPDANTLQAAMRELGRLSPLLKRSLIDNAVDMVTADHTLCLPEIELLRAFCEMLDCPMPPVDDTLLVP